MLAKKKLKAKENDEDYTLWYAALKNYGNPYSYDNDYHTRTYIPYNSFDAYKRNSKYRKQTPYSNSYTPVSTYNYLLNKLK